MIVSIIACILGIIGVIGGIQGVTTLLCIGAVADVAENLYGVISGQQKSLATLIVFGIGGFVVGRFCGVPWWIGLCFGLCAESIAVTFFSLATMLVMLIMGMKKKQ